MEDDEQEQQQEQQQDDDDDDPLMPGDIRESLARAKVGGRLPRVDAARLLTAPGEGRYFRLLEALVVGASTSGPRTYLMGRRIYTTPLGEVWEAIKGCLGTPAEPLSFRPTTDSQSRFAVKMVNVAEMRRYRLRENVFKEAAVLKELRSDHDRNNYIIPLIDCLRSEAWDYAFTVTPLCDGTLGDLACSRPAGLGAGLSRSLFSQVLRALEHTHTKGICHHDIHGGNILVVTSEKEDFGFRALLTDFGMSQKMTGPSSSDGAWEPLLDEEPFGMPAAMAPEVKLGLAYDGPKCDLWQLGVTLVYGLTLKWPWPRGPGTYVGSLFPVLQTHGVRGLLEVLSFNVQDNAGIVDFLEQLLVISPVRRLRSATRALEHSWFAGVTAAGFNLARQKQ